MASAPQRQFQPSAQDPPRLTLYHPDLAQETSDPRSNIATKPPQRVGIVAGWGEYPMQVASSLRERGVSVYVAAIKQHAAHELRDVSDDLRWFGVCKLGGMQRYFRSQGVHCVCLAGKLFKDRILFHGWGWIQHVPDWECIRTMIGPWFSRSGSTTDDSLLGAVVSSFERHGMEVVAGTEFATSLLAEPGILTDAHPSRATAADIEFGWKIAKTMGGLDIGQSITVKDRTVLAVEAIEGTDALIDRTGTLCPRGKWTLVKVAKPQQDMRFDLPTIGPQTIERLVRSGGSAIAIEAGKTILIDRERTLRMANRHNICIESRIY